MAKKISNLTGCAVGPWDLDDEKFDEWIEVINAMADELPEYQAVAVVQTRKQDEWRARQGYRNKNKS